MFFSHRATGRLFSSGRCLVVDIGTNDISSQVDVTSLLVFTFAKTIDAMRGTYSFKSTFKTPWVINITLSSEREADCS